MTLVMLLDTVNPMLMLLYRWFTTANDFLRLLLFGVHVIKKLI